MIIIIITDFASHCTSILLELSENKGDKGGIDHASWNSQFMGNKSDQNITSHYNTNTANGC